jgi:hypothetical protein
MVSETPRPPLILGFLMVKKGFGRPCWEKCVKFTLSPPLVGSSKPACAYLPSPATSFGFTSPAYKYLRDKEILADLKFSQLPFIENGHAPKASVSDTTLLDYIRCEIFPSPFF